MSPRPIWDACRRFPAATRKDGKIGRVATGAKERIQKSFNVRHLEDEDMEFGHRHLKLVYMPLLKLTDDGIRYRGRSYGWADIEKIEKYDNLFSYRMFYQIGTLPTYVYLKDGRIIKINAKSLELKGINAPEDVPNKQTSAYRQLIRIIEEKWEHI